MRESIKNPDCKASCIGHGQRRMGSFPSTVRKTRTTFADGTSSQHTNKPVCRILRSESAVSQHFPHTVSYLISPVPPDILCANYRHTAATSRFIAYLVHQLYHYTIIFPCCQGFRQSFRAILRRTFRWHFRIFWLSCIFHVFSILLSRIVPSVFRYLLHSSYSAFGICAYTSS